MGLQETLKALSDPTRREILTLLRDGNLHAGEIAAHFQATAPTISHHLAVLKHAGLIVDTKEGKYIHYELNLSVVEEMLKWVTSLKGEKAYEDKKDEVCGNANSHTYS